MSEIRETEAIDHVPGQPGVTAWRQAARRHQSRWREAHDWPAGQQRRSKEQGGGSRLIGSRVDEAFARERGVNFLNDATRRAVAHRLATRQMHETLDEKRLQADLLSSMPMCFNLFGPLWDDPDLAAAVVHRWFPDLCPPNATVAVGFEWSPGRSDPVWLADRTAFDAVLHIRVGTSMRLIGIETKYHEYPLVEPVVTRRRGIERNRVPRQRYIDVTAHANLFAGSEWMQQVWGTSVEQVWRDHLLALACQQQSAEITEARYVLIAPAGNPAWGALAASYAQMLTAGTRRTFEYRSLEALIDIADDLLPHATAFRARYLALSA